MDEKSQHSIYNYNIAHLFANFLVQITTNNLDKKFAPIIETKSTPFFTKKFKKKIQETDLLA